MNKKLLTAVTLATLTSMSVSAQTQDDAASKFKQDRAAILALAGKFKVDFNFHEIFSLKADYTIREKKYHESAHELVKVVEDNGRRIVLQHLLQVDDGTEIMVVKHWGQVWTYEDPEILEYQQGTTWKKRQISAATAKGTWSQFVTQTDDSPRYESYGTWRHDTGSSVWRSEETARPLPRREYSKRSDYDVVMGYNTHTITPQGWVHEQSNKKLVKRNGQLQFLCAERGFNTYFKAANHDFKIAENYWQTNSSFWENVRSAWSSVLDGSTTISYQKKVNNVSLSKAIRKLNPSDSKKKSADTKTITNAIHPYLIKPAS